MKIRDDRNVHMPMILSSVRVGSPFEHDDDFYIKTDSEKVCSNVDILDGCIRGKYECNKCGCVNISTGNFTYIDWNILVTPIYGEFVIED